MRVAIIGAGFAGIICAGQLEKYGIVPDVFEKKDKLGEPYPHVGGLLQIINRPIKNPLQYLNNTYGLNMKSSGALKKVIHYGPSTKATITGQLGDFILRSDDPSSLDYQVAREMKKSNIKFNTFVSYKELKDDYDHIVVADGSRVIAKELGVWHDLLDTWVKGAVILGEFETDTLIVWINKDYCNAGYAYLTPFSEKRASLILVVTETTEENIDDYWDRFISKENLSYEFVEFFKRPHYSGHVYPHRVENTFFIGNSGGAIDPFLGFGTVFAIVTGAEAAKSIAEGLDYEAQIKWVVDHNLRMAEFRNALNTMDNNGYDALIKGIGFPGVNSLIYNTNINAAKLGSAAIKITDFLFGDRV